MNQGQTGTRGDSGSRASDGVVGTAAIGSQRGDVVTEAGRRMALKQVLIADDSRVFRILMSEVLLERGIEVFEAANGREAFDIMLDKRPQLAILDGLMPLLSGFEVIQQARVAAPNYKPVIFIVTAVYKSRGYEADARRQYQVEEYLQKPLEPEDLLAAIARHFPEVSTAPVKA
jgi:CheY-like chemotaxis protein